MIVDYEKGGRQKDAYNIDEVVERTCPLCNSSNCSKIYSERGSIGIVRCKDCSLIYTNAMVKEPEKNYWVDEKKYFEEARLIFKGVAESKSMVSRLEELSFKVGLLLDF